MNKKKNVIIDVTKNIIASSGLKSATAGYISEKGGFSKAIIFYHFENIDCLLESVLKDCANNLNNILRDDYKNFLDFSSFLYKSIEDLIKNKERVLILKVLFTFAHEKYYFNQEDNFFKNVMVEKIKEEIFNAIKYFYPNIKYTKEVSSLISLIITSFYGLGIFLVLDEEHSMLLNNWNLQCTLISHYLDENFHKK